MEKSAIGRLLIRFSLHDGGDSKLSATPSKRLRISPTDHRDLVSRPLPTLNAESVSNMEPLDLSAHLVIDD
jgi:hypothetical protein